MPRSKAFFADPANQADCETFDTTDADHGRLEQRHHRVCHHVDWLVPTAAIPTNASFPALATIAMVEATTERNGKTEHERRYYLSSASLDAKAFAAAVRAHWGIENRLHWVLDVVFHDDLARLRTGHGPATWPSSSTSP